MKRVSFAARSACVATALCALALTACPQGSLKERSSEERSRELLREGLEAQRSGDDGLAQVKLEASLKADALNPRARTALASLHAGRAGIVFSKLVEPLYEAASQLDSDQKSFIDQLGKAKAEEVDNRLKVQAAAAASAKVAPGALPSNAAGASADLRDREFVARTRELLTQTSSFLSQMNFFLAVFNIIPNVDATARPHLEKAIAVLRADAYIAADRSEEPRIYLALLGSVRLIADLRTLVGKPTLKAGSFTDFERILCELPRERLSAATDEIRKSLLYMEEGLTPSPGDPDTSKRRKRKRLQEAVTSVLSDPLIQKAGMYLNPASDEGRQARTLANAWCGKAAAAFAF